MRRSGGCRGVCKREYTVKRGSAKGNTLQKRGFLKGIHCEKGICKGIHCKREYTVKREYRAQQKGTVGVTLSNYAFEDCGHWSG